MSFILRTLPLAAAAVATMALGIAAGGIAAYYYLQPALPSVAEMREIPLQIPLRIYSRDGRLMQQVGEQRRTPVAFDDIPDIVVQAFLAAEDDRFFEHPGFDYQGILRAAVKLLLTGARAQGGSTITQQLARNYFLSRDRTFIRKAKELILAMQIEKSFTKQEILELYLNRIFLGQRSYGVAAAAQVYFGKTLDELSVAEAATIAGLPAAPSRLNPVKSPELANNRRSYVLRRMQELDFIDSAAYSTALDTPRESHLHAPGVELDAPHVAEMARSEMLRRFGRAAYTSGYQVVTTIDSKQQRAANRALRTALLQYDRRHGFRGAVASNDLQALLAGDDNPDLRLQEKLQSYPRFEDLRAAIVLAVSKEAQGSAEFFLHNIGRLVLPWERVRWKRHINDDVISGDPVSTDEMLDPGDIVYLLKTAQGWQLAQLPEVQGAFVALDPFDGATTAMVGGFDYAINKFNRAEQSSRQPGSSFKPFVYSAALENGFTAASIINDAPIVVNNSGQEEAWRPENHSNKFYGPTRLREGLVRSMNLVSLRVLQRTGIANALAHLRPFGFPPSAIPRDLSLALGSGGASPMQMAQGYAVLANGGMRVNRYIIERILDAQGNVLYQAEPATVCRPCAPRWFDGREQLPADPTSTLAEHVSETPAEEADPAWESELPAYTSIEEMAAAGNWQPDFNETPLFWEHRDQAKRVLSAQNAYIVYDMMRDVIRRGTGRRARDLGRTDIGGKTGTSNDRIDAWFCGFNADLVGIAWVGFDANSRSLGAGEEGGRTALPIWKDFMAVVLDGTPNAALAPPEGLVTVKISPRTGLAARSGEASIFEIFREGNEPRPMQDSFEYDSTDIYGGGEEESIF
jgi:penicillin-binding protein 1A